MSRKPGRPCTICAHLARNDIESCIRDTISERNIAARFRISPSSVHRHKGHIPREDIEARDTAGIPCNSVPSPSTIIPQQVEADLQWTKDFDAVRLALKENKLIADSKGEAGDVVVVYTWQPPRGWVPQIEPAMRPQSQEEDDQLWQ